MGGASTGVITRTRSSRASAFPRLYSRSSFEENAIITRQHITASKRIIKIAVLRIYSPPPSDEDGGEPPAEASLPEEVPLSPDDADDTGADVLDDEPTELSDVADELLFDSDEPDEPSPELLSEGDVLVTGASVTVLLLTSAEAFSSDTDGVMVVSEFSAFAVVSVSVFSFTVVSACSGVFSVVSLVLSDTGGAGDVSVSFSSLCSVCCSGSLIVSAPPMISSGSTDGYPHVASTTATLHSAGTVMVVV